MPNSSAPRSDLRITSFAAASLWHRRLARTVVTPARVRPRVSAELLLHPVVSKGLRLADARGSSRDALDAYHAA